MNVILCYIWLDAGVSQQFRVVRDNRVNQNASKYVKLESCQHSAPGKEQVKADFPEKRYKYLPLAVNKFYRKSRVVTFCIACIFNCMKQCEFLLFLISCLLVEV